MNQRTGDGEVLLTSPRLAHKGHNLAGWQRQGEVFEYLEAGAAGVAVDGQVSPSQTGFLNLTVLLSPPTGPCLQGVFR